MTLRCEILSTGDEVVTGAIVDTNAAYLANQVATLGFEVARHVTVGDDRLALAQAFEELGARADVVLCTGGLGPTVDDLTAEVVASVLGVDLKLDEPAFASMLERWKRRGQPMPANNRKQAMIPEPAEVLTNTVGTAPGFAVKIARAWFFFMPGVPREMTTMFTDQVVPRLERLHGSGSAFEVRVFRSFGLPESAIDEMLADIPSRFPLVKLGFRALSPEVQIKLTLREGPREAALAELSAAAVEVANRLGPRIFSTDAPIEEVVGKALAARGATLAIAESCTGGLVSELVTSVPGSSAYFDRAFITYSNASKIDLLGVPSAILDEHGAVSEPCARAMAEGARRRAGSTYAVSITGIAGPDGGTPEKPVGLVFLGIATPEHTHVRETRWVGTREHVRRASAMAVLDLLRRELQGISIS